MTPTNIKCILLSKGHKPGDIRRSPGRLRLRQEAAPGRDRAARVRDHPVHGAGGAAGLLWHRGGHVVARGAAVRFFFFFRKGRNQNSAINRAYT